MDFAVRTHEVVYSLQDLGTFRNGGFFRDMPKKNKGKVGSSLRKRNTSSLLLLSLGSRKVTAFSSSLETPYHMPRRNCHISSNADSSSYLWNLVVKEKKLNAAYAYIEDTVASQREITDIIACGRLIQRLCAAGRTSKAARVVELLERSEETTLEARDYTVYVKGLCEAGEVDNAVKVLRRLHSEERLCNPDVYLYNIVMNAMFGKGRFEQGMKLLDEMRGKGVEPNVVTCSIVVNGMYRNRRLDEAMKLVTSRSTSFHGLSPGVESYNIVLSALCHADRYEDAAEVLADMDDRGISPCAYTFGILIRVLCSKTLLYRAITLLESMPQYGCTPSVHHYELVIRCLCKEKNVEMVIECIEVMISRGCYPDIVVFNTLLAALCKYGQVDAALEFFNELINSRSCQANLATYNIMIEWLSRLGRADEALELLNEIRGSYGFKPKAVTYAGLIVGLIGESEIHKAVEIWHELRGSRVVIPPKCYFWIIKALCDAGDIDRAIDLVVYVVSKGFRPSQGIYASLVEGLASAGLVEEGWELLNELSVRGAMDKEWTLAAATRIENMCRFD